MGKAKDFKFYTLVALYEVFLRMTNFLSNGDVRGHVTNFYRATLY